MAKASSKSNQIVIIDQDGNFESTNEGMNYNYDELMTKFKTKSSVIRYLNHKGMKRSAIASFMNIKYQFVRNVLTQPTSQKQIDEVTID